MWLRASVSHFSRPSSILHPSPIRPPVHQPSTLRPTRPSSIYQAARCVHLAHSPACPPAPGRPPSTRPLRAALPGTHSFPSLHRAGGSGRVGQGSEPSALGSPREGRQRLPTTPSHVVPLESRQNGAGLEDLLLRGCFRRPHRPLSSRWPPSCKLVSRAEHPHPAGPGALGGRPSARNRAMPRTGSRRGWEGPLCLLWSLEQPCPPSHLACGQI